MQTTTLPSINPLSVSLGPPHHHNLLNRHDHQHRGGTLAGHFNERPSLAESDLSAGAPPGITDLSNSAMESVYEDEDDENSVHDRPPIPKGEVNNYSGIYTRDEILALHRLDFPVPPNFAFEEDITSKIALEPVASSKYIRKPQENLRESHFFALAKSNKGRGRGRRFMEEHQQHGLNYSSPIDPRSNQSESLPHHISSPNLHSGISSNNPNASPPSLQSSHQLNLSSGNPQTGQSGLGSSSTHYNSSSGYSPFLGEDFILDDEKWYYKDPKQQERGPFGSMQMDKWVKFDFFKVDLMVRRENSDYVYLGDIFFSEGRNPFTGEPLDQWFMGPTSEFKISLMLLIQNYHLNRMKQDQPQQMQYQFNMNQNSGELNTSTSSYPDPYHQPYIRDSQSIHKSSSTLTAEIKPNVETTSINPPEKKHEEMKVPWHLSSSSNDPPSLHQSSNQNQAAGAGIKDWNTLQQEQTLSIQQIVAQMNKPKKAKKKKGKKSTPTNPPSRPAQNTAPNPSQKKPQEHVKSTNNSGAKSSNNSNTQNNINSQKNTTQPDNKNKPQSPPQAQSITKKPKPQYKVKEPSPSAEPEPELIKPEENVSQTSNQTQFKRPNVRQPKVWKRKDEGVDEHN